MSVDLLRDSRWAWRNVRARGSRGVLSIVLLGVALAANVLLFAAADSLLLRPLPYDEPERLVQIQRAARPGGPRTPFLSPPLLDGWRAHEDLFAGIHGYLTKTIFLTGDGVPALVQAADITPGLIELLGAWPRWGRSLVADDARQTSAHVVLISEALARARFGEPSAAVGRHLDTTGDPLQIAGVMPKSFRFPQSTIEIWRALDPRGPLARGFGGAKLVDDLYARYFDDRLLAARIVGAFGVFAFIVAMAGVYAVIAFLVVTRTREIGIRMALGAHAPAVRRLVLGSAMRMVGLGAFLGLVASLGASRLVRSQLFGVDPTDPATWR